MSDNNDREDAYYLTLWILFIIGFIGIYQFDRSGKVIETVTGDVVDCYSVSGWRGVGSYIAIVELSSIGQVKVKNAGCRAWVGESRVLAKKRKMLSKETFYVFEEEL